MLSIALIGAIVIGTILYRMLDVWYIKPFENLSFTNKNYERIILDKNKQINELSIKLAELEESLRKTKKTKRKVLEKFNPNK